MYHFRGQGLLTPSPKYPYCLDPQQILDKIPTSLDEGSGSLPCLLGKHTACPTTGQTLMLAVLLA